MPELPVSSGRFGSLIPAALALFRATWEPDLSQVQDEQEEKDKIGSFLIRSRDRTLRFELLTGERSCEQRAVRMSQINSVVKP